jgi:transcriptional regulator with XRE-family HTH domain
VTTQRNDDGADNVPSRLSDLGAYIRNQRESAKLSLRNLAKLAGVSNPYLSQIERGLRKPSAEILQAIARALSISSETLYVKAGILEERDIEPDLEEAIDRDPHLSEDQKTALVELYRMFRQQQEMLDSTREAGPRKSGLQGLLKAMSTGEVDDADVAAANPHDTPGEDD